MTEFNNKLEFINILNDSGKYEATPKEELVFDNDVKIKCLLLDIQFVGGSNPAMGELYEVLPNQEKQLEKLGAHKFTNRILNSVYDNRIYYYTKTLTDAQIIEMYGD